MTIEIRDNKVYGNYRIAASISPDKESDESKTVTLNIIFNGSSVNDVFAKACSSARISWQNGVGRPMFESWDNGQVVNVDFDSPGRKPVDNRMAMIKSFMAIGLDEATARTLADKAVDDPTVLSKISG